MLLKETKSKSKRGLPIYIAGIVIVLGGVLAIVLLASSRSSSVKAEGTRRDKVAEAGPQVAVTSVIHNTATNSIMLQGDAVPYSSATLFAKLGGYLKKINVDKGDRVKEGEVLAVIESPETDQQYLAALADAENKQKIEKRDSELLSMQLLSPAAYEQAEADAEVSTQNLAVIRTQKSYEILRAPFSGTISARYVDPGALIQDAVNQETTTQPVVAVAQVDRLRVDVYVDQRYAPFVHVGDEVEISLAERPGFVVKAKVARSTGQLDPQTRMQLVEIEVPNKDGNIVAWSTVNVALEIPMPSRMEVPTRALVVRGDKYFVPVVDNTDHINFREVHIGKNDGQTVEILDGLNGTEQIGLNVGSTVQAGGHVRPVTEPTAKQS